MLRKTRSVAVTGDRAHYVADLASNVVALVGHRGGGAAGVSGFDAVGGLAVAAVLLWGAICVFRQAADELMDHELPDDARARIVALMTADPRLTRRAPTAHPRLRADRPHPDARRPRSGALLEAAHEVVVAAERRVLEAFPGG